MHNVARIRTTAVSVIAGLSLGLGVFAVAPANAAGFFGLGGTTEPEPEAPATSVATTVSGFGSLFGGAAAGTTGTDPAAAPEPDPAPVAAEAEEGWLVFEGAEDGSFEPMVVADNESVYAAVTGIALVDGQWTMTLDLENRAATETMFNLDEAFVNDWAHDPFWAHSVPAGEAETVEVSWYDDGIDAMDVDEFLKVEFLLEAYDNEDWSVEDYFETNVRVFPKGEQAYANAEFAAIEGDVVYDDGAYRLTFLGGEGESALFCFENCSDAAVSAEIVSLSVNGVTLNASDYETLPAGKKTAFDVWISEDELTAAGIETCDKMNVLLTVTDEETYDVVIAENVSVMETEGYVQAVREAQPTDILVFEDETCSIVAYDAVVDEDWGSVKLKLYVVNKTDRAFNISSNGSVVDGVEVGVWMYHTVGAGEAAYIDCTWEQYALEEAGLTDAEFNTASIAFEAYETVGYDLVTEGELTL